MSAWRMVGIGGLCAAFLWGCEERQTAPETVDRPVMQAPDMSAPDGQRSAASGETLRREQMPQSEQPNPAEVPGGRAARRSGQQDSRGMQEGERTPRAAPAPEPMQNARPGEDDGCADPSAQQPRNAQPAQQGKGMTEQQPAQGGSGQEGTGEVQTPSARETPAVREEEATIIAPGLGEPLDPETIRQAERAAREASEGAQGERVVIANVEFGGRIQEVSPDRVVVRDQDGNLYEAQLEEQSAVMRRGEEVSAQQLREGMQVRASLDLIEGNFVVRELEQVAQQRRQQRRQRGQ